MSRGHRRLLGFAGVVAVAFGAFALGRWSISEVVGDDRDDERSAPFASYTVEDGVVEDVIILQVEARWPVDRTIVASDGGVVTGTPLWKSGGAQIASGDRIATIDLEPLIAIDGDVPMFRELTRGTSGPDVTQLQRHLRDVGIYRGPLDGAFGVGTDQAVRSWQRTIGFPETGSVSPAAIVFVPDLPRRARVTVGVGDLVSPEASLLELLADEPELTVAASETGERFTTGTEISIELDGSRALGRLTEVNPGPGGTPTYRVELPSRRSDCGACDEVPIRGRAVFEGRVETVPRTTGPLVPISAIGTSSNGTTFVRMTSGVEQAVTVVAASDGLAVVKGVEVGATVQIPTIDDDG